MSFLKKFMKMIAGLDEEEKQAIKTMLDGEGAATAREEAPPAVEESAAAVDAEGNADNAVTEEVAEATDVNVEGDAEIPAMESTQTDAVALEGETAEPEAQGEETVIAEETAAQNAPVTEEPVAEEVPSFDANAPGYDEDMDAQVQGEQIQATDGTSIPVDYKEIVEAQNARIMALEAENSNLKAKTEGAFGFSMKPSSGVKVNPLYGDTSDLHFKR